MNPETTPQVKKDVQLLQTLRDEVRLQLHLGSMEAKEHWSQLESRIEGAIEEVRAAGEKVLKDLVTEVEEFRKALKATSKPTGDRKAPSAGK